MGMYNTCGAGPDDMSAYCTWELSGGTVYMSKIIIQYTAGDGFPPCLT